MAVLRAPNGKFNFQRLPTLLLVMKSPVTQVDDRSSRWEEVPHGDTAAPNGKPKL